MAKSVALRVVSGSLVGSDPASRSSQMSHPKGFDLVVVGQGRGRRRPMITAHAAKVLWAGLMERRCGSREETAVLFGVTFQTACNWWDGMSCPTGDKVMIAVNLWPEEFGLVEKRKAA